LTLLLVLLKLLDSLLNLLHLLAHGLGLLFQCGQFILAWLNGGHLIADESGSRPHPASFSHTAAHPSATASAHPHAAAAAHTTAAHTPALAHARSEGDGVCRRAIAKS